MARAYTGSDSAIVLDNAYHGNTDSLINISPYKFNSKGGQGKPKHVEVVPMPDLYRGEFNNPKTAGKQYAHAVQEAINKQVEGSIFIAES